MLLTVQELQDRVSHNLPALIEQLTLLTGRGGRNEKWSWERSLPQLAKALAHPSLAKNHISLEYLLPGTGGYCDAVLLGRYENRPSAVVIELKDWQTNADRPGKSEGLIERFGAQELHPSDQVKGYVEYCRRFHSAVLVDDASVHGFVLFTNGIMTRPYRAEPNDILVQDFPIFTMLNEDIAVALPEYLSTRLTEPDPDFAAEFVMGTYNQDRGFMAQIGRAILDGDTRHFELLGDQRRAFHLCLTTIKEVIENTATGRQVILIEGAPGSGKSAVAAQIWGNLVIDRSIPNGSVVLVTTSKSQSTNWVHLLDQASEQRAGCGIARKATSFHPISPSTLGKLRKVKKDKNLYRKADQWRENLEQLEEQKTPVSLGAVSDSIMVSLVDEAHGLINPEKEHGTGQFGFCTGLGPQAYHIMRCSRLTVFFMDSRQSFRVRENTTVDDIETWARELGATVTKVSLLGNQFRCAGSVEYVSWVESLLKGESEQKNRVFASAWYKERTDGAYDPNSNVVEFSRAKSNVTRKTTLLSNTLDFRIFSNPYDMESALRGLSKPYIIRLLSSYSREWKTEECPTPHEMPAVAQDFYEAATRPDGEPDFWHRPWNYIPNDDYTLFVSGRAGSPISKDALCEVGCTYAVRGFDFDYIGLLWLNDLLWRDGTWIAPLENIFESGISPLVRQAKSAAAGAKKIAVLEKVSQAYRILLTRAIRGVFVWIPDEETRLHVLESLDETNSRVRSNEGQ